MNELVEVGERRRKAVDARVRKNLFESCRKAIDDAGGALAGYALVTWTRDGNVHSSYDANDGPIRDSLVPTLAADALNRHVAVVLATGRDEQNNSY